MSKVYIRQLTEICFPNVAINFYKRAYPILFFFIFVFSILTD